MGGNNSKLEEDIQYLRKVLAEEKRARENDRNDAAESRRRAEALEEIKQRWEEKQAELAERMRQESRTDAIRREDLEELKRKERREDRSRSEDLGEKLRQECREDNIRRECEDNHWRRKDWEEKIKSEEHRRSAQLKAMEQDFVERENDKDREHAKWMISKRAEFQLQLFEKLISIGCPLSSIEQLVTTCLNALEGYRSTPTLVSSGTAAIGP